MIKLLGLIVASIILLGVFFGYLETFYVGIACGITGILLILKLKGIIK